NKKARIEYEIIDTYEGGLSLFGFEVKSLRRGDGSLVGARVVTRGGEAFLVGASIPAYQEKNAPKNYDLERSRKVLLNRKEIEELDAKEGQKRLTILPLMVYNKGRRLKLQIGVLRHKTKRDKRESLKSRDAKRDIERTLKNEY
ncbi:MAG: SsrA-binding protein SmpB, partial [Patescibacteria group bacterium]|nr:SsrA-binding protein SmpB [Patescibacteria group bacterium]